MAKFEIQELRDIWGILKYRIKAGIFLIFCWDTEIIEVNTGQSHII